MLIRMLARPSLSRDLGNERKKAKESRNGNRGKLGLTEVSYT